MYKFSSYWQCWSRILDQSDGWTVELDLTPINPTHARAWDKVAAHHIRRHCTPADARDIITDRLPRDVLLRMTYHLGSRVALDLVHGNILAEIDWEKYERRCNGGCNLADCSDRPSVLR